MLTCIYLSLVYCHYTVGLIHVYAMRKLPSDQHAIRNFALWHMLSMYYGARIRQQDCEPKSGTSFLKYPHFYVLFANRQQAHSSASLICTDCGAQKVCISRLCPPKS